MKKKISILLVFILVIGLCVIQSEKGSRVYAKTAQMYIELPESVKKEQEIVVKVVLDSDVNLYSVDAYLSYDAQKLLFVPCDDVVTGADGILELKDVFQEETKKKEYEIRFKILDVGDAYVNLTEVYLIDYEDLDYLEVAPSIHNFNIDVNESVSGDARLVELTVAPGELTPLFDENCIEYEMYVGLDVDTIGVTAVPVREDSVVELEMPETLKDGENTVKILVTALSGETKEYIIHVIREERKDEITDEIIQETTETTEEVTENRTQEATEEVTEEHIQEATEAGEHVQNITEYPENTDESEAFLETGTTADDME